MKRKVLSVIMTGAMVAGLAGTVTVHAEEQQTYNIGICQLVQHEALDAATEGFKDAVKGFFIGFKIWCKATFVTNTSRESLVL